MGNGGVAIYPASVIAPASRALLSPRALLQRHPVTSDIRNSLSSVCAFVLFSYALKSHLTSLPGSICKMDPLSVPRKLWEHPDPKSTEMYKFMQLINTSQKLKLNVHDI